MSDTIETWRRDHANFSRLLDVLEAQIGLFHQGRTPNYTLMRDIIYYMTHYPDLFHHPKEDRVYEKIKDIDGGARAVVDELMRQHAVLRQSGGRLLENLEAVTAGAMLARASVEAPGYTYISFFRDHMRKEESEIFPLAVKFLSDADWSAIDTAVPFPQDPLFGESVQQRYLALHQHIAGEAGCGCGV